MNIDEQRAIMIEFHEKHPDLNGLNITQMAKVLSGDLIIVKSGTRHFYLMTKAECAPGGKLDQHNAEISRMNKGIRAINRNHKARARARAAEALEALRHGDTSAIENLFTAAIKGE